MCYREVCLNCFNCLITVLVQPVDRVTITQCAARTECGYLRRTLRTLTSVTGASILVRMRTFLFDIFDLFNVVILFIRMFTTEVCLSY